ncbi:hypothetical protein ACFQOY_11865 [Enterococcus alcedinis]|uniref:Uncharacterized protein n=1 Tax=Enterococcus alcedinis TaxID=1274384 RepID=A0A917N5Y3_9ENTE|nr:hypothetical protein [Enterococcus alcedinis]MBP2103223.1 hypothetical protein [Enterococcus alcedinis]GGI66786.1 hypothetical protein GCM10011482_24400 [Enterococcus alcedinis]
MEQFNQYSVWGAMYAFFEKIEEEFYESSLAEEQGFPEVLITPSYLEDYLNDPGKTFFVLWYKIQEYLKEVKKLDVKKYTMFEEEKAKLIQLLIQSDFEFIDSDFFQSYSFLIGYLSHIK